MDSMDVQLTRISVSSDVALEAGGKYFILTPCAALEDVKTVIGGHSHAAFIARALVRHFPNNPEIDSRNIALEFGFGGLRGGPVTQEYEDILVQLGATRNIAVVWNGNQHNADFLLSPEVQIDLIPRGYPVKSTLPNATIVAESAIRAHFQPTFDRLVKLLTRLSDAAKYPRLVIGTPPPLFDEALIRKRLKGEPVLTNRATAAGFDIDTVAITPASVRLKLWFVLQRMMAEIGEAHGASYVNVPTEALDENGFLKPELSAGDVTHAGPVFGAMMARQIARALQKQELR